MTAVRPTRLALDFVVQRGFLVHRNAIQSPAEHAIEHAVHGWTYLLDDGSVSTDPPT